MSEARAQEIIVLCLFITLASTTGAELTGLKAAQKLEAKKTIVAGFFAMLFSSILAEFAPSAGAYLAVLVAGVTFFRYGLPTIETYTAPTRVGRKASK